MFAVDAERVDEQLLDLLIPAFRVGLGDRDLPAIRSTTQLVELSRLATWA